MQPVAQVRREVISRLAAPMPDSVFVAEFTKPRNWGFNTAAGNENPVHKNSIGACIYRTTTVTDGKEVPLRLTEPMRAGGVLIPANTVLTGTARIDGERMMITVSAVQYRGSVIPVELLVYDMDGGEGIRIGKQHHHYGRCGDATAFRSGAQRHTRHGAVRRAEDAAGSGDAQSRVSCPAAAPAGITRKTLNIHKPNTLKKDKL